MPQNLINHLEKFLNYTYTLNNLNNPKEYNENEVNTIIELEKEATLKNYFKELICFYDSLKTAMPQPKKNFIIFWGYPGAGKSHAFRHILNRFEKSGIFEIVDKDDYRTLFSNLEHHLKGHSPECEKFADIATHYVRTVLDLGIRYGNKSILSIGALGAGTDFQKNAIKAMQNGFEATAVYLSVHKEVAAFSNIYRNAMLYQQLIQTNTPIYPRLVCESYFEKAKNKMHLLIDSIHQFTTQEAKSRLLIINRQNQTLYDSKNKKGICPLSAMQKEESRAFNEKEIALFENQLDKIEKNIKYRMEKNIHPPTLAEITSIQNALQGFCNYLIDSQNIPFRQVVFSKTISPFSKQIG